MLKKFTALLLAAVLTASICGCGNTANTAGTPETADPAGTTAQPEITDAAVNRQKYTGYIYDAFDTNISFVCYCSSQEEFDTYYTLADEEFQRLHRIFDIYNSYDGLNNAKTVNDNAGAAPVRVPDELYDLIETGIEMYRLTGGRVNIAMGSVLSIWHDVREYNAVFSDDPILPDDTLLHEAAEHCSIDDVILDEEAKTVYLSDSGMSLDLGAIAKGRAAELVCELLKSSGCTDFAISAGGNVKTEGCKPDGSEWVIGIQDPTPTSGNAYAASVHSGGNSVVTSGVYQRYFMYEGRRYHHIIDGETLYPENRYDSITVISTDSGYADALSTALFNMDYEEGRAFAESLDDVEVLWIFPDGEIQYTEGFEPFDINQ